MPENELRTLLAQASADRPPGIRLTPARPHARRTRLWLPVATVAAAATALVLILPGTTPSADAQVMAAVETTSAESYRIATTSGDRTFTGAFDPARRVGVIVRERRRRDPVRRGDGVRKGPRRRRRGTPGRASTTNSERRRPRPAW